MRLNLSLLALSFFAILFTPALATAVPRMSLTAGTPCSACHINGQGGGMRTEIGWGASVYTGAYIPEKLEEMESNSYFDGLLSVGTDIRLQTFRGSVAPGSDELPSRLYLPMQLQPYIASIPTEWLTLYGSYNIGPSVFRGDGLCNPVYAGQSCFEAAATQTGGRWLLMARGAARRFRGAWTAGCGRCRCLRVRTRDEFSSLCDFQGYGVVTG